jgi:tetratricopeptide (TPR) repeat protein
MRIASPAALAVAVVAASGAAAPASAQPHPTFTRDIAPVIWNRCATCHRPGQAGPFSLISYDDVKRRASLVGDVVAKGVMPPWKPVEGHGEFADARRLTPVERELIRQWVAGGAAEGNRSDLPPLPSWSDGWQFGTPDVVAEMPAPYGVRAEPGDVFRTFVIPIPIDRPRFVRAIEFRPDNARVVHHATLGIDRTRSSRILDARDDEPGYAGGMVQDARYPEGHLLGWTPGQRPHAVPDGTQWRLEPGSDLVVQLHLQPTGKPEPLTVRVGFFLTDDPPTRTPLGLRLGRETIDIPPGSSAYVSEDRYVLPVDVDVVAIQPHAHNLARSVRAAATLPDGSSLPLIEIDDWDFRWQDVYRYVRPVALPRGTTLTTRFTYDNSAANPRNPHRPPARVVWGQNTTDEMGDVWLQVIPRNPADGGALLQDSRRKAFTEDLAAYSRLLEADPTNPLRLDAVALLYLENGRLDEAIQHYTRSLSLNDASPTSHYNLGIALAGRNRRDDAVRQFEEAVRLDPSYAAAHNNLGALLLLMGRPSESAAHYRQAIALRPDNVDARTNLGVLLSAGGRPADAVVQFREVLKLRPSHPPALAALAWIEATTWDDALRNGDEAVTFAERAVQLTGRRDLAALDALGAAYALVGRFDEAAAVARSAADAAAGFGAEGLAARFRERQALYEQRRPYRVPPPQ